MVEFTRKEIPVDRLSVGGIYQWKKNGEFHLFNPQTVHLLQYSTRMNDYNTFKKYSKLVNEQSEKACTLRSLLHFKKNRSSISIDEVEPAENIYKRFATGAMSFGSISWEAHTTLAIAMNRLGGKSNTGEGGEDERRYEKLPNGDYKVQVGDLDNRTSLQFIDPKGHVLTQSQNDALVAVFQAALNK